MAPRILSRLRIERRTRAQANASQSSSIISKEEELDASIGSMLQGMSNDDILNAVDQTRNGETPAAWKNANSKEISKIIETVFDSYVQKAEQDATDEMQSLRDEASINFVHQTEFVLDNYSSVEEIMEDQRRQLIEIGISPVELKKMENKFIGRILDSEFDASNVLKKIRTMDLNNPYMKNIKPGTQAEARFVNQLQSEVYKIINEASPAIAAQMPNLRKAVDVSLDEYDKIKSTNFDNGVSKGGKKSFK